jgi:hypothetical protein
MPYKPEPDEYSDPPYDPGRFARLQREWIEQHGYSRIFEEVEMESPESVRLIGRCKWCGCTLYGRFFMNSLEEMFWEKGYPDCKHYDPDYSIEQGSGNSIRITHR